MRTTAFAIALLMSGAAIAQTAPTGTDAGTQTDAHAQHGQAGMSTQTDAVEDGPADTMTTQDSAAGTMSEDMSTQTATQGSMSQDTNVQGSMGQGLASMMPASGQVVQPGNNNPEEDARGIEVVSAPAMVPAGWNGTTGTAVGGPAENVTAADDTYPACSRTVTDNCVQAYERGRSR